MAIKVSVNEWKTNTRPCDFSLCLVTERGGVVYADFDSDCCLIVPLVAGH